MFSTPTSKTCAVPLNGPVGVAGVLDPRKKCSVKQGKCFLYLRTTAMELGIRTLSVSNCLYELQEHFLACDSATCLSYIHRSLSSISTFVQRIKQEAVDDVLPALPSGRVLITSSNVRYYNTLGVNICRDYETGMVLTVQLLAGLDF